MLTPVSSISLFTCSSSVSLLEEPESLRAFAHPYEVCLRVVNGSPDQQHRVLAPIAPRTLLEFSQVVKALQVDAALPGQQ